MLTILGLAIAAHLQGGLATWRLSPTPTLTIEDDGTPATEFAGVVAVARLSNGRVAVVNRGTTDIRIFDAQARHIATFGRTGGGPGEFRRLEWVGRSGDTAWFHDSGLQRLTTVNLTDEPVLAGVVRVTATGGQAYSVTGRLPDGRWVVSTRVSPTFDGPSGTHRLPGSIGIIPPDADGEVTWLGEFRSAAIFVHNPTGNLANAAVGPIAFPPWLRSATGDGLIWIGDSGGDSLIAVRARDRTRFTIRLPIASRAPSRELVTAAREQELASNRSPQGRGFVEAKFSERYLPERLPYFEALLPGPQGELWVQEYAGDRALPTHYLVFDSTGRPRARVAVTGGDRIREVGRDYVLIVREDADGVESVRLHRLERR